MIINQMDYTFHDHELSIEEIEFDENGLHNFVAFLIIDGRKLYVPLQTFMTFRELNELALQVIIKCDQLKEDADMEKAGERHQNQLWEASL
tara:strand:- start:2796 stop:3068 length:273 start_codon:yes stop_codon:yes gene_type:complete